MPSIKNKMVGISNVNYIFRSTIMQLSPRPETFMAPFVSKVEDVNKISDSLRFRVYRCPDFIVHNHSTIVSPYAYDQPHDGPQKPVDDNDLVLLKRREIDGIIYLQHRYRPSTPFRLYVAFDIAHSDSEYRYIDKRQLLDTLLDDMERQLSPHMLEDIHIELFIPFSWSRFYKDPGYHTHAPSTLYADPVPVEGNTGMDAGPEKGIIAQELPTVTTEQPHSEPTS